MPTPVDNYKTSINNPDHSIERALFTIYNRLYELAIEDEKRREIVQIGTDQTKRVCRRCGCDAYKFEDFWVCWCCEAREPADSQNRINND